MNESSAKLNFIDSILLTVIRQHQSNIKIHFRANKIFDLCLTKTKDIDPIAYLNVKLMLMQLAFLLTVKYNYKSKSTSKSNNFKISAQSHSIYLRLNYLGVVECLD